MLTATTSSLSLTYYVDAVNIDPMPVRDLDHLGAQPVRAYHHGQLNDALVDAGVQLAREGGPDALVIRELSRRVGVSHNAAYRHFPDRDALLAAVSARCMALFAVLIERRVGQVPLEDDRVSLAMARLRACGQAYVEFALTEPGLFHTAFSPPTPYTEQVRHTGVGESGLTPYELLGERLDELVEVGALPPERRPGAELSAWSAVHGYAALLLDGPLRGMSPEDRTRGMDQLLATIHRGL
jgi:AcrR family transcriptional regulator